MELWWDLGTWWHPFSTRSCFDSSFESFGWQSLRLLARHIWDYSLNLGWAVQVSRLSLQLLPLRQWTWPTWAAQKCCWPCGFGNVGLSLPALVLGILEIHLYLRNLRDSSFHDQDFLTLLLCHVQYWLCVVWSLDLVTSTSPLWLPKY